MIATPPPRRSELLITIGMLLICAAVGFLAAQVSRGDRLITGGAVLVVGCGLMAWAHATEEGR